MRDLAFDDVAPTWRTKLGWCSLVLGHGNVAVAVVLFVLPFFHLVFKKHKLSFSFEPRAPTPSFVDSGHGLQRTSTVKPDRRKSGRGIADETNIFILEVRFTRSTAKYRVVYANNG